MAALQRPAAAGGGRAVRVAVWGCGHGELDTVYDAIEAANARAADGRAVELLICCGDFQAVRNAGDLEAMACPVKYRAMRSFYKYYAGQRAAPVLTLFVGGNHEASNHLQELHYGGWVAPRVYYLGASGVVRFRGLRVAGVSGIFKRYDFNTGYHERAPYSDDSVRSVFHVREYDYHKLSHLALSAGGASAVDVMISHDWPEGAYNHGDTGGLLRAKKHFREEVAAGELGNPASAQLLGQLRPRFWFAGHLHVKFAALVPHAPPLPPQAAQGQQQTAAGDGGSCSSSASSSAAQHPQQPLATRFLALDKCLPGRDFFQIIDIPVVGGSGDVDSSSSSSSSSSSGGEAATDPLCAGLCFDDEWMAVTAKTHAYMPLGKRYPLLPHAAPPTPAEVEAMRARLRAAFAPSSPANAPIPVPLNFAVTAPPFVPSYPGEGDASAPPRVPQPGQAGNPQTDALLAALGLRHNGLTMPCGSGGGGSGSSSSSSHSAGGSAYGAGLVPSSVISGGGSRLGAQLPLPPPPQQPTAAAPPQRSKLSLPPTAAAAAAGAGAGGISAALLAEAGALDAALAAGEMAVGDGAAVSVVADAGAAAAVGGGEPDPSEIDIG